MPEAANLSISPVRYERMRVPYGTALFSVRGSGLESLRRYGSGPDGEKEKRPPRFGSRLPLGCQVEPFSNRFIEDLNKIWELRKFIPDPCNPKTARV